MSLSIIPAFEQFRRGMNTIFQDMERDFFAQPLGDLSRFPERQPRPLFPHSQSLSTDYRGGQVSLDLTETDGSYKLSADLPGMSTEDIHVDVDPASGVLTLTGDKKQEREEEERDAAGDTRYHYVERSFGKIIRSIRLPENADVKKASAEYDSGVLRLTFPKHAALPSSRVKIPITNGRSGGNVATQGGGA